MLKLLSKFVLQVLPPASAAVIAIVLLFGHPPLRIGDAGPVATTLLDDQAMSSQEVAQRIEDEHASLTTRDSAPAAKPVESQPDPPPVPKRGVSKRPPSRTSAVPAAAPAVPPIPAPSPLAIAAAGAAPAQPSGAAAASPQVAADPASKPEPKPEPKRVFGVPIPAPISEIGSKLDPSPVFQAGGRVLEKIVVAAKSVVPDFSK